MIALGIGFYAFLPETVVGARYFFAAVVVLLAYHKSKHFSSAAARYGIPSIAAILMLCLLFADVETGAKIALGGGFLLIFPAAIRNMLRIKNKMECAAIGAAGIAAFLFGIGIWVNLSRFDLIECRKIFCVTSVAGALTLLLQPFKRSEK